MKMEATAAKVVIKSQLIVNKEGSKMTMSFTLGTSSYYYGSGYSFNSNTGQYSLTGKTNRTLTWSNNYQNIIENAPFTCNLTALSGKCFSMYKVTEYLDETFESVFYYVRYEITTGVPQHLSNLNSKALTYCNSNYTYGRM